MVYTIFFIDICINRSILFTKHHFIHIVTLGTIYIYIISLVYGKNETSFYSGIKKVKHELVLEIIILIIGFFIAMSKFSLLYSIKF